MRFLDKFDDPGDDNCRPLQQPVELLLSTAATTAVVATAAAAVATTAAVAATAVATAAAAVATTAVDTTTAVATTAVATTAAVATTTVATTQGLQVVQLPRPTGAGATTSVAHVVADLTSVPIYISIRDRTPRDGPLTHCFHDYRLQYRSSVFKNSCISVSSPVHKGPD